MAIPPSFSDIPDDVREEILKMGTSSSQARKINKESRRIVDEAALRCFNALLQAPLDSIVGKAIHTLPQPTEATAYKTIGKLFSIIKHDSPQLELTEDLFRTLDSNKILSTIEKEKKKADAALVKLTSLVAQKANISGETPVDANGCREWWKAHEEELLRIVDLNLNYCQLERLSPEIAYLKNLQSLSLTKCQLQLLSKAIGQLIQLETLHLDDNFLQILPNEIKQLQQLKTLHVGYNSLKSLPDEICDLPKLQHLIANGNQLTALPKNIGQLQQLNDLEVAHNRLTSLPDGICDLPKLQRLFANDNQLTALPQKIGQLQQRLIAFEVGENPCGYLG